MEKDGFGERLEKYRKKKGLSQEKLAEYMEVSRQAVTKWERSSVWIFWLFRFSWLCMF